MTTEIFQDVESKWMRYFQHNTEQMNLNKKSFFIGMMYSKIIKNLEDNISTLE